MTENSLTEVLKLLGGYNEYPQSMFWSKKNRYTPVSGAQRGIHYTTCFHECLQSMVSSHQGDTNMYIQSMFCRNKIRKKGMTTPVHP